MSKLKKRDNRYEIRKKDIDNASAVNKHEAIMFILHKLYTEDYFRPIDGGPSKPYSTFNEWLMHHDLCEEETIDFDPMWE